ncbi:MAG: serine--tRNA ligase [Phycisphaeraceae bacterium]|nr:serine--tRNA ligase [Phycisphaeraceae bacterium]
MIDLRDLRENPDKYRRGCELKGMRVDIDHLLELDAQRRALATEQENLRAQQRTIEKELGPQIGKLAGQIKKAAEGERASLEAELDALKARPAALKEKIHALETRLALLDPDLQAILLTVPLPPDADVPVGKGSEDNIEIRRWHPPALVARHSAPGIARECTVSNAGSENRPTQDEDGPWGFDTNKSYEANRGFRPKTHLELVRDLGLADFERGVKMAGTRSYVLTGDGFLLHNAVLRYAFDFMTLKQGFSAMSVPVLVREDCMVGTGFFPAGREQAYHIEESRRGETNDLFLTGTGEVGLMGLHQGEILDEAQLPLKYTTVSTCFRREAGAAGKDTAGLYRIHQFDKVEQVVICRADEAESRAWHKKMIGYVEEILQSLALPYRLLQCCTGDLGVKNADMIDVESWMPGRGEVSKDGVPSGAFGETHSASRLYDYQCRRLNMRYREGGAGGKGATVFCHSLNNTVAASPRLLIPILEMWQNADGTVTVPPVLRPYMGGKSRIG